MEIGFFFWPYTVELCERLARAADRYGYAMIGIADTPGNAMDPWVAATVVAQASRRAKVAICVTNLVSRHPAVSVAIASLDLVSSGRAVLGIGAGHSGTKNLGLGRANANPARRWRRVHQDGPCRQAGAAWTGEISPLAVDQARIAGVPRRLSSEAAAGSRTRG